MVEPQKSKAGRLNPFALPTETDARFTLLLLSAPALVFGVSQLLRYIFDPNATNPFAGIQAPPEGLPLDVFFQEHVTYWIRLMLATVSSLILPALLIGIIFLAAAVLYRDHPRRIQRRKRAVPYAARTDPRFEEELSALTAQAGLPAVPGILLGNRLSAQDGQAFGVGRKKSLYLDAGLRLLLRKSVENFRAIVRHELAHIANHDIGRTYFAQSLWSAVIWVTILPLVSSAFYLAVTSTYARLADGVNSADVREILFVKLPTFSTLLFQAAGLILLVVLIRAGLLRTREVYADWRAALWGSGPTLASIFEAQMQSRNIAGLPPFRLHPSPAERLQTLREPRRLFQVHFDIPFLTGVFTSLILNGLIPIAISLIISVLPGILAINAILIDRAYQAQSDALQYLYPFFRILDVLYLGSAQLIGLMPFLIQAPLAAATLGLQVQRQALADLAEERSGPGPYLRLALPAILMGFGVLVGILLSPLAILKPGTLTAALPAFLFLIVFVFFIWLVLVYTRFFSLRLLGSHTKRTPTVGKYRFLTVLVTVLFLLVETPLVVGYLIVLNAPALGVLQEFLILIGLSVGMLILFGLTFLACWVVYSLYRIARPVRCSSCGRVSSTNLPLGRECQECGQILTPWLFITG